MPVTATPYDRQQTTQRVKVGLIGLAAVLLLIGLASAVFNAVNRERAVTAIGGAQPATVAAIAGNSSAAASRVPESEPLAEMGVSGTAPQNGAAPARR